MPDFYTKLDSQKNPSVLNSILDTHKQWSNGQRKPTLPHSKSTRILGQGSRLLLHSKFSTQKICTDETSNVKLRTDCITATNIKHYKKSLHLTYQTFGHGLENSEKQVRLLEGGQSNVDVRVFNPRDRLLSGNTLTTVEDSIRQGQIEKSKKILLKKSGTADFINRLATDKGRYGDYRVITPSELVDNMKNNEDELGHVQSSREGNRKGNVKKPVVFGGNPRQREFTNFGMNAGHYKGKRNNFSGADNKILDSLTCNLFMKTRSFVGYSLGVSQVD